MIEEYQIWTLFNSGRIGSGLNIIWTILLLWLALRVAVATRNSKETNLFAKIVSSAFGILAIGGAWQAWTNAANLWVLTAYNLSQLEEKSETAEGFMEFVGTTDLSLTPQIGGVLLLLVIAIMIAGQIWYPKK